MKTSELFTKEIGYISDETLKKIVVDTLDASPECIQTIPASSSGKYHPVYSLGDGGLVRHVRAAVGIAHSMIETDIFKNIALGVGADDYETIMIYKDVAYAALILHDCMKPDDTPKHGTRFDHPLLAATLFKNTAAKYVTNENMNYMKVIIPLIHSCIASHMGNGTQLHMQKVLFFQNLNLELRSLYICVIIWQVESSYCLILMCTTR